MLGVTLALALPPAFATPPPLPYDESPDHLWNRLHRQVFVRTDGDGREHWDIDVDPPIWPGSTFLLQDPTCSRLLRALDEFIAESGETLITDPVPRAVLQRDLWAVFDWADRIDGDDERRDRLQRRLAVVIRRLALDRAGIETLPDTLPALTGDGTLVFSPVMERGVIPSNVYDDDGEWVRVTSDPDGVAAPTHVAFTGGRARFSVLLLFPKGREQAIEYLRGLGDIKAPFEIEGDLLTLRADLPQIPAGTGAALTRQMIVLDRDGRPVPTRLTESLQLRFYKRIERAATIEAFPSIQSTIQADLARHHLVAGVEAGMLQPVSRDERRHKRFGSHGFDPYDRDGPPGDGAVLMSSCMMCHGQAGLFSLASISGSTAPMGMEQLGVFRLGDDRQPPADLRTQIITDQQSRDRAVRWLEDRGRLDKLRRMAGWPE